MKIEEAPCEGAPSLIQTSYPVGCVKFGGIQHSAVTSSTLSITAPDNVHQVTHTLKTPKDFRLAWLNWHTSKCTHLTPMGVRMLNVLVLEGIHSTDQKIIISNEELAEILITSPKVVRQTRDLLVALNMIRILIRGSALSGRRRICSEYALGLAFEGVPQMMRGKDKGKPYDRDLRGYQATPLNQITMGVVQIPRGGERATPSPICTLNTHTKKLPLAFTKENWLKECLKLNPNRDLKDIDRTFEKARDAKGAKDSDWLRWAKHFDSFYEPTTKASPAPAPKSWQRQPSKPQEPSCHSPRLPRIDYNNPKVLEDVLYYTLRNGNRPDCILASVKDSALAQSVLAKVTARLESPHTRSRIG